MKKEKFLLSIDRGENMHTISKRLESQDIIPNRLSCIIAYKILSLQSAKFDIKMGDFMLKRGMNCYDIVRLITSNNFYFESITFPEGLTVYQMLDIINKSNLKGNITMTPAEGTLMPETYNYTSFDTKDTLIKRMQKEMGSLIETAMRQNRNPYINNSNDLLTFASIVEKETGLDEERRIIASVFVNRLAQGMKLQTDPTVIYEITQGKTNFGRKITKSDIKKGSLYNTYQIFGLPIGPIACPSRKSILASIDPANTKYLYFVAMGSGEKGHIFSEDYQTHRENVAKYWKLRLEKEAYLANQ